MKNFENYALGSWIEGEGEGKSLYNAINGKNRCRLFKRLRLFQNDALC